MSKTNKKYRLLWFLYLCIYQCSRYSPAYTGWLRVILVKSSGNTHLVLSAIKMWWKLLKGCRDLRSGDPTSLTSGQISQDSPCDVCLQIFTTMYWCFGIHHRSDTYVLPNNWVGQRWAGGVSPGVCKATGGSFLLFVMLVWWLASTCWHTFYTWPNMYLTMGSVIQVNATQSTSTNVDTARQLALCYAMILITISNA